MLPGKFASSSAGQVLFGSFAGGVTAELTGGNFWMGAVTGATVSWLNHVAHKNNFQRQLKKYYGNKLNKPVYDMNQADITEAISNIPTLKKLYLMILKKFPNLEVSYSNTFGVDDGVTYFNSDLKLVEGITIFRGAGSSYKYMAETILHEFGHAMSGVRGFYFKNVEKYGRYSDIPRWIDEIYAHKFAFHHGGVTFSTSYYKSFVGALQNTVYKINAEAIVLPQF